MYTGKNVFETDWLQTCT